MTTELLVQYATLLVPMGLIFYFLLFRPQQQRMKQHKLMIEGVKRGDTVVTAGGLIGKVTKVKDDGELMIEIADNVQVRIVRNTVNEVRAKGSESA